MAILDQLTINSGTYPDCGQVMQTADVGTYWTHTRVAGGGPSGGDCVEFAHIVVGAHAQYYFGWTNASNEGGVDPAFGSTRYHRFYVRFVGAQNYAGNSGPWATKWIIHGEDNPGVTEGRMIIFLGVGHINNTDSYVEANKNVSGVGTASPILAVDTWHAIQVGVTAASGLTAADATIKMWVNNDTFASPTDTETGMAISKFNWSGDQKVCGGYAGTTVASGGTVKQRVGAWQYADSFDASWFANMGTGGGGGSTLGGASACITAVIL